MEAEIQAEIERKRREEEEAIRREQERREREESEAKELEKELKRLELEDGSQNKAATNDDSEIDASEEEYVYYYNN